MTILIMQKYYRGETHKLSAFHSLCEIRSFKPMVMEMISKRCCITCKGHIYKIFMVPKLDDKTGRWGGGGLVKFYP